MIDDKKVSALAMSTLRAASEETLNSECENCAFRDKCGSPQNIDLALNARLVLMADEAAKEEGKTLSQWLTNLIAKELFY